MQHESQWGKGFFHASHELYFQRCHTHSGHSEHALVDLSSWCFPWHSFFRLHSMTQSPTLLKPCGWEWRILLMRACQLLTAKPGEMSRQTLIPPQWKVAPGAVVENQLRNFQAPSTQPHKPWTLPAPPRWSQVFLCAAGQNCQRFLARSIVACGATATSEARRWQGHDQDYPALLDFCPPC